MQTSGGSFILGSISFPSYKSLLIAIRLTKLVVPPNGSSIARLYYFLSSRIPLGCATYEVKHNRGQRSGLADKFESCYK